MREWGRGGHVPPSDEKIRLIAEILSGILSFIYDEFRKQELMTDESFFAASIMIKFEDVRGGTPMQAVVSLPDDPEVTAALLDQALEHVREVLTDRDEERGSNGTR